MREKRVVHLRVKRLSVSSEEGGSDICAWLEERAAQFGLRWVLAHTFGGVVWGEYRQGRLVLAGNIFPGTAPSLYNHTLQQARLFGPDGELLLWKNGEEWKSRAVIEGVGQPEDVFDEVELLWGGPGGTIKDGFTCLAPNSRGLRQVVPVAVPGRVGVIVRHVVRYREDDGTAYIALSRLVDFH